MVSRVFLVTGATNGIGKHTAMRLAMSGATVLVHGRTPARVEGTVSELIAESSNQNIKGYIADLSSLASIRALSDQLHASQSHIDVLINNAGIYEASRLESKDGFELTFAVNVMAPFLLTSLVLDLLKKGKESRIINVSSISQTNDIKIDNLQLTSGYGNGHKAYDQSKTCDIMITLDMAARFKNHGITVNCLDPGTVNTQLLLKGWGECGIPISEADDEFHLATGAEYANVTGEYFVNLKKRRALAVVYEEQLREELWSHLVELTGAVFE